MSRSRRFSPSPAMSVLTLVLLLLFIRLGFWQLDRAAQKQALLDGFAHAQQITPRPIGSIDQIKPMGTDEDVSVERIRVRGTYLAQRQLLLENQINAGRAGYHVLTPLRLPDGVLMVDRGWIPAPQPGLPLPALAIAQPDVEVVGLLRPFPRPGWRLGKPWMDDGWPRRVNYPTAAEVAALLDMAVAPRILLLDAQQPQAYVREWQPQIMGPGRHYAYAAQWFGFAVVLVILYVFLNMKPMMQDE